MRQVVLTGGRRVGSWTRPRNWSSLKWGAFTLVTRASVLCFVHRQTWGICLFWIVRNGERFKQWPECDGYEGLNMIARRAETVKAEDVDHVAPLESKLLAKHTGLIAHCAAVRYTDGSRRKPGTMSISTQGQSWVVVLNDLDTAKRLKVVATTLDAALTHANVLVQEHDAPWEDAPWLEQEAPKRRKK